MKNEKANEMSHQFLQFIFKLMQWLHNNYFKGFNINGKGDCFLTDRQFSILVIVHELKTCTISDLSKELNVSNSSLSIVVSKLVKEGYLQRQYPTEEQDRRKTYLSLTEKGMQVLTEAYERIMVAFGDFFSKLDINQQNDLKDALIKLDAIFGYKIY